MNVMAMQRLQKVINFNEINIQIKGDEKFKLKLFDARQCVKLDHINSFYSSSASSFNS